MTDASNTKCLRHKGKELDSKLARALGDQA